MPDLAPVSIIIPTFNDGSYLGRLLSAVLNQDYENFEVIISDAHSKDKTGEVVESFKDSLKIDLVQSPPKGPGAGRNEGAKHAKGEWLLFLDADDDLPDNHFISELIKTASSKGWQTASALVKHADARLSERIGSRINYHYIKMLSRTKHPVAPGWCILTRRNIFEAAGGFNEKIQFGEDYDYVSRVGKYGFGFVESTYYFVDLRRPREEGWRFVYKGIANEVYRLTHHFNLEKNPYKYEFGKHRELKK